MRVMRNRSHCLVSVNSGEFLLNRFKMNLGKRFPNFRTFLKESDLIIVQILRFILKIEKTFNTVNSHLDSIFVMGQKVITQKVWKDFALLARIVESLYPN